MNAPAAITIATATALAIAWAVPAQGIALSTRLYQGAVIIDVVGAFEPCDSDRFMATVEATPRATMVVFNSSGGHVDEGEAIGAIIENHHLATGVAAGGQCSSACVLAWAAGARKSIASRSRASRTPDAVLTPPLPATKLLNKLGISAAELD